MGQTDDARRAIEFERKQLRRRAIADLESAARDLKLAAERLAGGNAGGVVVSIRTGVSQALTAAEAVGMLAALETAQGFIARADD